MNPDGVTEIASQQCEAFLLNSDPAGIRFESLDVADYQPVRRVGKKVTDPFLISGAERIQALFHPANKPEPKAKISHLTNILTNTRSGNRNVFPGSATRHFPIKERAFFRAFVA